MQHSIKYIFIDSHHIYKGMFTTVMFVIPKYRIKPKCPSIGQIYLRSIIQSYLQCGLHAIETGYVNQPGTLLGQAMSLYFSMTISHAFVPDQLLLLIDGAFLLTYSNTFIWIIYQVLLPQKPFIFLKRNIASLLYFLYAEFTLKLAVTSNFISPHIYILTVYT